MNITNFPIISDQISRPALAVVITELENSLKAIPSGAVVEFGCYIGTTSLFMRRLMDERKDNRPFHVYDSFEGLPPKSDHDQSAVGVDFTAGALSVSKKQFLHEFQKAKLRPPNIHRAWFDQLEPSDVPDEIAFAFLDGDFYDSIMQSLALVWPRMVKGGTVTIDDYNRETLPGVAKAVHDYFGSTPAGLRYQHNIAIIKK